MTFSSVFSSTNDKKVFISFFYILFYLNKI